MSDVADRVVEVNDSSQIELIAYWKNKKAMRVNFLSGDSYLYQNIEFSLFTFIASADSVGKAFAQSKPYLATYQKIAANV